MARKTGPKVAVGWRQPSWLIVLIAGGLVVFFLTGMTREVIRWYQVRQQVQRLQKDVATEQQHQQQLQDLIDYLHSPTFQEREARLKLGLKKDGERVILVPNANEDVNGATGDTSATGQTTGETSPSSPPARWWHYFFGNART